MSIKKIILLLSLVFGFCFTTSVNAETRLDKLQKELSSKEKSLSKINSDIKSISGLIKKDRIYIKNIEDDITFFKSIKEQIESGYVLDVTYSTSLNSYKSFLNSHKKEALKEIQGYKKKLNKFTSKKKKLRKSIRTLKKKINNIKKKSFNGVLLSYNEHYNVSSNKLTKSKGVVYYNGHRETYYSQKVLAGGGLKISGRHVAKDGTVRDKDGYICVAANPSFYPGGATLMISLGPAKVYDCGCAYGTIDVYCNW